MLVLWRLEGEYMKSANFRALCCLGLQFWVCGFRAYGQGCNSKVQGSRVVD